MKWALFLAAFFMTTVTFAANVIDSVTTVVPGSNSGSNPCVYSSNFVERQRCEQLERSRLAREQAEKAHGVSDTNTDQTATPPAMPAWQQALQHPQPTTEENK